MAVMANLDYPSLFRQQLANGLNLVLSEVRAEHVKYASYAHHATIVTRATHVLNFVLSMPECWQQTSELLLALSPTIDKQGRWREWLPYLRAGAQLARAIGDLTAATHLDVWIAVFCRSQGHYAEARQLLQNSAAHFATLGDNFQYARTLNLLAWTERLAGNRREAQRMANDALRLLTSDEQDVRFERARSTSILGAVCYEMNDWSQAEHFYRQTLQVTELALDRARLAWGYADLGLVLSAQGRYAEAVASYQDALGTLEDTPASVQVAVLQMNLAGIYLRLNKPTEALNLCRQAQQTFQRLSEGRRLIMVEINIGIAYHQLHQFDEAQRALRSADGRADRLNYHALRFSALYQLGRVYLSHRHYEEAITTFERALRVLEREEPSPQHERYREEVMH